MIEVKVLCDGCGKELSYQHQLMKAVLGQLQGYAHTYIVKGITGATEQEGFYHVCDEHCLQTVATQRGKALPVANDDAEVMYVNPTPTKAFH